jgi:hypothetical protein
LKSGSADEIDVQLQLLADLLESAQSLLEDEVEIQLEDS